MAQWRAAAASTIFTPDEPVWLAGYAARTTPAHGKISDLRAKALALEDEAGVRLLLLTVDLIGTGPLVTAGVRQHLQRRHGLQEANVLFAASHTHYGPEVRPDKALFFGSPDPYVEKILSSATRVREALIEVSDRALAALRPAELFIRRTAATFADNRRAQGDVVDHDVPVLEVIAPDDRQRLAVVFGYACHNTTIPPEDGRYCGDWAGFAQERVEEENPGCTALFVTGAAADQNPHPRGSVELSRQYGRDLADAVVTSLATPGREVASRLRIALEKVDLPLQPVSLEVLQANAASADAPVARKARFLLEQIADGVPLKTSYPAPIHLVRLGEQLTLIAMPGEPVNDYAHRFKREFGGEDTTVWVAGYCNDMFGYLPTARVQREGGYEGGRANLWSWIPAPFDETVENRIIEAVRRLIAGVSA